MKFESACSMVVAYLQKPMEDCLELGKILEDCMEYMNSFDSICCYSPYLSQSKRSSLSIDNPY